MGDGNEQLENGTNAVNEEREMGGDEEDEDDEDEEEEKEEDEEALHKSGTNTSTSTKARILSESVTKVRQLATYTPLLPTTYYRLTSYNAHLPTQSPTPFPHVFT